MTGSSLSPPVIILVRSRSHSESSLTEDTVLLLLVTPRWGSSLCLTALRTLAVAPPTGALTFSLPDLPAPAFSELVLALPPLRGKRNFKINISVMESDCYLILVGF